MTPAHPTAKVTVTLAQPVAAGTGPRPDYRSPTHQHIPGAVLRGACAAEWIRRFDVPKPGKAHRARFLEIFEGDGVFGPLYKKGTLPVPISVLTHKYGPTERCRKLWWDVAVDADPPATCPECSQQLERSKGKPWAEVGELHRTRAALDLTAVARKEQLFRTDALARGQIFTGWVSGPAVDAFCPDGTDIQWLRLGGDRSTSGLARVQVDRTAAPESLETDGTVVVLRLAAPGIFVDDAGLPTDEPDPAELAGVLGVGAANVQSKWVRWGEAAGWHVASGLPKPSERCVTAGSTYLIGCDVAPDEDALRRLRVRGVGLRRREGFGALCPPIRPPVTLASLTGMLAPLRAENDVDALLQRLRDRTPLLEGHGTEDEHLLRRLDQLADRPRTALRTLLEIEDVGLYREALDFLDRRKATR